MSANMTPEQRARARVVDAKRRKRNRLAEMRGEIIAPIPAAPVRQHARALIDLGWSCPAIIAATGCTGTSEGLRLLATSATRKAERKWAAILTMPVTLRVPETVPDDCLVPYLGATRRVRSLMAAGWRHDDISAYIGRASHHISAGRYQRMTAIDWRIIDAAYERLSSGDGGSEATRTRARKAGYLPPFCWDDVDDPAEVPTGQRGSLPPADRAAEANAQRVAYLEHANDHRHTLARVSADLGITEDALWTWCRRNGRGDLWEAFKAREKDWAEATNRRVA